MMKNDKTLVRVHTHTDSNLIDNKYSHKNGFINSRNER